MNLQVQASCAVIAGAPLIAYVGQDPDGIGWTWLKNGAETHPGQQCEVATSEAIRLPDSLTNEQVIGALRLWPAWRISAAARLELGSCVMVAGAGPLLRPILEACALRGCLWRAVSTQDALPEYAEYFVDDHDPRAVNRVLPRLPDAIIVIGLSQRTLARALAACRGQGTVVAVHQKEDPVDLNVYPDLHRRTMRLVFVSGASFDEPCRDRWLTDFPGLLRSIVERSKRFNEAEKPAGVPAAG